MKLSEFVRDIIKDFLIIFASIIIIITFLRQIYYPNMAFDLKSIYIIMSFSLLSALTGFILYSPNDLSEKKMRIRIIIHFFTLEILLIVLGSAINIVNDALGVISLALQIAVIYIIVRLLSWQNDKKDVKKINEKLKLMKKELGE
ncbi:DUF3021 family protein [Lysinibacillus pakistanensis]|uniref:DUF3021 family protein n=1 Tax=Lysinibacillus pakistanensis TaxID=759811 RepID=A0AAX3WRM3_9BACI|nr:DUF3021 family protein [Lysinibacillus pakistanensis]MDM5233989.1 DUF3021 family protein [Lysinibacillus pakistanensis]QGG51965.1 DUF3021 family protein [Lysinibacillus pakistanensis]WHY44595.1 DUF3021 family protein [Lysinibacillus pakistanensis]WHY49603.1 DUF3021 family protein [Lysinibacillus pakistanensis]